ncbi:MAG: hypothetical protein LCI00_05490 [Chloroflexi bacterium]|nr:hypothetical protein [Chloroflexota bacterium]
MRRIFVVPVGLLVLTIIGFALGTAGQMPFVLVLAMLCAAPMFFISVGFAAGKASNRYNFFVPKEAVQIQQPQPRRRQPAAGSFEINNAGDLRGN